MARPDILKLITTHKFACSVLILVLGFSCPGIADQSPEREQTETRLIEVAQAISELRDQLETSRADHRKETARIREVDLAIQKTNLNFRALEQEREERLAELASLERQREEYLSSLDERLGQLAEQVRSSYRVGSQSRMKLVLNQDDPTRLGRMLAYYDYLNQAQIQKISSLKEALSTLETMHQSIDRELIRIKDVQTEQRLVLDELNQQREARAALLSSLSNQINSDESRLRELEQNRKDLEALLERLTDVLADIPADLGNRASVSQQKGKLPMPLKGPVKHAFGQSRAAGLRWQGWLIGSSAGAEVGAIAYGRVAFADWLRGYGLMMIIDHGQGYLSLYGHNESLLHEVGAWVEPGDIISVVGSNPGSDQGLYFELRKNGKAVDPAAWLKR